MLYEAGVIAMLRERHRDAFAFFDEGLSLARERGGRQAEGVLLSGRGTLLQEQGKILEALEHHAQAVVVFREVGNRHREGSALYYLAGAYVESEDRAEAMRIFDKALAAVRSVGAPRYEALVQGCQAPLRAYLGELDAAEETMLRAEDAARRCRTEQTLLATLAIHRAHLSLVRDKHENRRSRTETAGIVSAAHASDDVRFARRFMQMAQHQKEAAPLLDASRTALVIHDGGCAFRMPGGQHEVDLSRRTSLKRILYALAQRRLESPGEALALEDLVAVGWPRQRITHHAAVNRVHVALATLRALGLRGAILNADGGYLLSPALSVVLAERRSEPG